MRIKKKVISILLFVNILFLSHGSTLFAQDANALKSEIYSKIECLTCRNMTIDKCNCPTAREMKAYIDALIDAGVGRNDIFYKVAKKFSLKVITDKDLKARLEKRLVKEAGDKRPQLILETALFDFGPVNKKLGTIRKVIKIDNKGNTDLIITNLKTSCGCVTASLAVGANKSPYFGTQGSGTLWQSAIPAGKSADLEIVLDLYHPSIKAGKVIREIFITSNDPVNRDVAVMIQLEVKE